MDASPCLSRLASPSSLFARTCVAPHPAGVGGALWSCANARSNWSWKHGVSSSTGLNRRLDCQYWHGRHAVSRTTPVCLAASSSLPRVAADVEARISLAASTGRLDLSDCGLVEVPSQVFQVTDLVDLSLAGNKISFMPDDIKNLHKLRRLGLAGNALQELPASIGKLQQLEGLWVHGNILHALPAEIGELRQLRMLALAGNKLSTLPESMSELSNLQILSVAGNHLHQIPAGVGSLKALKVLAVYGNCLKRVPESLGRLSSLQDLWLQGNSLEVLPVDLGGLSSLRQLSVADNLLTVLPDSIGELPALETLWLYGNRLIRVPRSLANLKKLAYVWLESNPLEGQCLWEMLPSFTQLKACGISSDVKLPGEILDTLKKVVSVSEISGTGDARSQGGYFKLKQWDEGERADVVVVAFGSAPCVPNWGGVLRRAKAEMEAKEVISAFDILYVVDSQRSWYTHKERQEESIASDAQLFSECKAVSSMGQESADTGHLALGSYYRSQLHMALKPYRHVIMLGDSMGASAALLFSPLATSVIAFCPQVDLSTSSIRPGKDQTWLQNYKQEVLDAVSSSSAKICVHCGTWSHDVEQAKLLPSTKVSLEVHNVDDHRLAKELDVQHKLVALVLQEIQQTKLGQKISI